MRRILPILLLLAGCSKPQTEGDRLDGVVTAAGEPVRNVTVVAVNAAGEESSALTDNTGRYEMASPPKGALKFRIAGFAPPPPPPVAGEPAPVVPSNRQVPARYGTTHNELHFDFGGGKQSYDISLNR